jgi:hypothetical protein
MRLRTAGFEVGMLLFLSSSKLSTIERINDSDPIGCQLMLAQDLSVMGKLFMSSRGSLHQTSKIVRLGFVAKPYRHHKASRNIFVQRRIRAFSAKKRTVAEQRFRHKMSITFLHFYSNALRSAAPVWSMRILPPSSTPAKEARP